MRSAENGCAVRKALHWKLGSGETIVTSTSSEARWWRASASSTPATPPPATTILRRCERAVMARRLPLRGDERRRGRLQTGSFDVVSFYQGPWEKQASKETAMKTTDYTSD